MAEAALGELAKALLEQLASPAMKEFKLIWGHKKELKKLEGTINTIRNVLEDADRKQADSEAVRGWLARLRVVLYNADDLLDHVSYMVLHEKANTGSKMTKEVNRLLSKPYRAVFVVKISQKVKAIREHLDDIAGDISKFGFLTIQAQTDPENPNRVQREQTHSYFPSSEVVGRDQEREDIVKLLLADNFEGKRGVSVVAVIGIGGMGKTTFGQFIYGDERVKQGFDLCMWCCLNYFSDLKGTLEAITKAATKSDERKDRDLDQLQGLLRNTISGKRFLLVLDDVWDEDAQNWHKLQILLDSGKSGSVVLVTTRSMEVAQSMGAAKPYYHLQGLSNENAWMLFKKRAFGEESEQHNIRDLEELGRQIAKKCGNSPLAIVIIASLLKHKEKNEWFRCADELSNVVPVGHDKVMQVLKMSYDTLPSPVKRCFAYCSLIPKDHRVNKGKLVSMWIAQGFVGNCVVGQSLEDVAEDYFFCLVNRCFIQNSAEGDSFIMHDLVHDLASKVAGSESILVDKTGPNFGNNNLRHVSLSRAFVGYSVEQVSSSSQSRRLRTFLLEQTFGSHRIKYVDKLIPCFKAMRVLDVSSVFITKIPDSVGQLIHLRYLDLSWNNMEMLPSSICDLHHLQYLTLVECRSLKELPKEIGRLTSLRHLEIEGCFDLSQMPVGLANLTSLVTLDRSIVHGSSGGLSYLEFLDVLNGSLRIELPETVWKNAAIDAEKACLSKKHKLKKLCIKWGSEMLEAADSVMNALQPHSNLESLGIDRFAGERMPCWISEIHNLVSLTIENCGRLEELPSLRVLRFLKEFKIKRMSSMVVIEEDAIGRMSDNLDSIFFPSLEILSICKMPNLMSWWKHAPSIRPVFRRLAKVTIRDCPKLTTCMPLFPQVEDLALRDIGAKPFWHIIESNGTSRLRRLKLVKIQSLRSLPGTQIRHLSSLQSLEIWSMQELTVSFFSGFEYLTSLEMLRICGCEKLEWIEDVGVTERSHMRGAQLPRLRILEIEVVDRNVLCKLLKYLTSLEELRVETFKEVLLQPKEEDEDGMVWKSLQKLRNMTVGCYIGLLIVRQTLPRGVGYLNSLQELAIYSCKEVYFSWGVVLSLQHLRILKIENVEKVIDIDSVVVERQPSSPLQELVIRSTSGEWLEGVPWRCFPSLLSLQLYNIADLEALPEGIQHLAALQNLWLWWCESVASFPCWMVHLSSLRSLQIDYCCEELKERCKRQTGGDWPNIQHIPVITIKP